MVHRGIGATRLAFALVLAIVMVTGCKKDEPVVVPPPGGPTTPQEVLAKLPGSEEFAAGKKVYADNNCARCHKLGETGGAGPGPDLAKTGGGAEHAKKWLTDFIRDPKKQKAGAKMPAFGPDKISDADLDKLAEYLASRK